MCDISNVVKLQNRTHLFIKNSPTLHKEKVREFHYKLEFLDDGSLNTQVGERKLHLDEMFFGEILGVPVEGIRSITGKICSKEFLNEYGKLSNLNGAGTPKKFLKGVYQLFFKFFYKFVLPRSEKQNITSRADLFMIETLSKFEVINLPAILLEHMHKTITTKEEKHGMEYDFLLTKMFTYFWLPLDIFVKGLVK